MKGGHGQSHSNLKTRAFPLGTCIPNFKNINLLRWKLQKKQKKDIYLQISTSDIEEKHKFHKH